MNIREIFHKHGLNYSQVLGSEQTVVSMSLEDFNKALDEISAPTPIAPEVEE